MKIEQIKKAKNIALLWFWKEGKSNLNFLFKIWVEKSRITILDNKKIEGINNNINHIYWDDYLNNLDKYDLIIKSPWISPYKRELVKYYNKIITQTSIFFDNKWDYKIIWVTATKWKSTTVSLLKELLINAWLKIKLVWNIWTPVLDEIDIINNKEEYDFIIYELSSYMLENLEPKCEIWLLGNVYKCHLDWHNNDYETYIRAKKNILINSKYKLIGSDFPNLWEKINHVQYFWTLWRYTFDWNKLFINNDKYFEWEIKLKWNHNKKNIAWALWVLDIINNNYIKIDIKETLKKTLPEFKWLSHRLEDVWTYKSITFIDDGISTTPESTIEAINTFEWNIDSILLWWWDYWFTRDSYKLLIDKITSNNISNIVLFPDTWLDIFQLKWKYSFWDEFNLKIKNINIKFLYTNKMESAINFVYKNSKPWKICLLSCAAPSYSLWSWYEEKWKEFIENIIKLKNN